jgi:hypothetical protein
LQIVGFILGALGVAAIAAAVAYGAGFSGWHSIGMGAACFVLAQVLYIIWLAGMARAEARRKQSDASGSATEQRPNLAQKG